MCLQEGIDLDNFSTCKDDGTENEAYRDDELEMSEKNTVRLLVSTDDNATHF